MFEPGFNFLDLIHLALILATCFACFVAGRIRGATGLVNLMLEYKVVTEKDLDEFQKKLEKEES